MFGRSRIRGRPKWPLSGRTYLDALATQDEVYIWDLGVSYQSDGGAVVEAGDPIGWVEDQWADALSLYSTDPSYRPTAVDTGDGALVGEYAADDASVSDVAITLSAGSKIWIHFDMGAGGTAGDYPFFQIRNGTSAYIRLYGRPGLNRCQARVKTSTQAEAGTTYPTAAASTDHVAYLSLTATDLDIDIDGGASTGTIGSLTIGASSASVQALIVPSTYLPGMRIGRIVVSNGDAMTADDIARVTAWVANGKVTGI